MSYKGRILNYLWLVALEGATNGRIARALCIRIAGRRLQRAELSGSVKAAYRPRAGYEWN